MKLFRIAACDLIPRSVFKVLSGKFLRYLISSNGIEVNPNKIRAIQDMDPPRSIRDVQKLTGKLAALNIFLSKSAQCDLPFFRALKKVDAFKWTLECLNYTNTNFG